jgi:hypothetical protein
MTEIIISETLLGGKVYRVYKGTMLQAGRSQVRFPIRSSSSQRHYLEAGFTGFTKALYYRPEGRRFDSR